MNGSIRFFYFRYLQTIEIYSIDKYKQTSIETKGPMIDHKRSGRKIYEYETTDNELRDGNKILKYTEMVKIRYEEIQ